MTLFGKAIAWMFGVFVAVQAFHAYGEPMTRTHSCHKIDQAEVLAEHLVTHGFEGYAELVNPMLESGDCLLALVPAIAPPMPPLASYEGDGYTIVVRPVLGKSGMTYALLIEGDARNIAKAAMAI